MEIKTALTGSREKILILEDNYDWIEIYKEFLAGHYDLTFITLISGLDDSQIKATPFSLMIADILLPDGDYLEWIISNKSTLMETTPTIIVSSMEDIETLRNSFEWGAADYLVKPFKQNEMLVKLERILKTKTSASQQSNTDAFVDELTLIENKLYQLLSHADGKVVSRDDLLKNVWKKVQVNPKTLDVHLSNLRKKIKFSPYKIESFDTGWKLVKNS